MSLSKNATGFGSLSHDKTEINSEFRITQTIVELPHRIGGWGFLSTPDSES